METDDCGFGGVPRPQRLERRRSAAAHEAGSGDGRGSGDDEGRRRRWHWVPLKSYSACVYGGTRVGVIPNIVTYQRNPILPQHCQVATKSGLSITFGALDGFLNFSGLT
ncbi:hypothetical protein L1987_16123 [Smallanthus sonchifolius]|uniref:Uncharacterized protein n=1 Tax=Smallanthus sonchifolius TaxID=185202 RepID=A0ACB9J7V2_9ASTR|nr:hypothetical protein L1987_16123 [Smallanthus sonchifolius]